MEPAMRYASFPLMRLDKAVGIGREHALELLFGVLVQIAGGADGLHHSGTGGIILEIFVPSYMSAQEPPVETPKLLFDGKTFTLPLESPVLQKRQIADTLLVGMPIEAYIEPLNLKLSEYKFALPNNPSQTIKRALLIHMANYKGDEEQNALMLRARNNVAQMLNLSGAKRTKSVGFSLDPVYYIRHRKEIKSAERARLIIRDLNKLDSK